MKKALIAVAALAVLAVAVPSHVQARNGGAVAAGVIGGLAVGAIVGGAIASQPRHYYEPAYEESAPGLCRAGRILRRRTGGMVQPPPGLCGAQRARSLLTPV